LLRIGFIWKLYLGIVVTVILTAVIVCFFVSYQIENDTINDIRHQLRTRAELLVKLIAPEIARFSPEFTNQLQLEIETLAVDETRLTIILTDGRVVADSRESPSRMDNHASRPEVIQALKEGEGTAIRFSDTLSRRMMYLALPIQEEGKTIGFVRTSLALTEIDKRLWQLRTLAVIGALIAFLLVLVPGYYLAKQISRPLAEITEAAGRIAKGESGGKLWRGGSDEVARLARAFDSMSEQLGERMETITVDRNKLLAILSGMVEGVIAVDKDEYIVHINSAAAKILEVRSADCIGKRFWEVTRIPEVLEALSATLREGEGRAAEVTLVHHRSDRSIEFHAAPLRDSKGDVSGAILVLSDITEVRKLATVRQDFIANVSHELKTPLTAMRGIIETLLNDEQMDAARRSRFIERLDAQSSRMTELIADIISLARVESKDLASGMELLDFREAVKLSFETLMSDGESKGLRMAISLPDEPVHIRAEMEALRRAIDNLIDNAIKYTDGGGSVTVQLSSVIGSAVLEVSDTGIGIEPREQERIFERFYRIDKARSRELGGSGLGLSIVKRTAMAFGGEVSVTSMPGKGSTFLLQIPLAT
jgi:two-component system phosphate regulon sensor histidine kinase PhoR